MNRRTFIRGAAASFFGAGAVRVVRRPARPQPRKGPKPKPNPPGQAKKEFDWAMTLDYPRPYCHGDMNGQGWPLLVGTHSNPTDQAKWNAKTIDTGFLQAWARFPLVQMQNYPIMQWRRDVADAFVAFNPNCHMIWWHSFNIIGNPPYGDTAALWYKQTIAATSPTDSRYYEPGGAFYFPTHAPVGGGYAYADMGWPSVSAANIADMLACGGGEGPAEGFHIDFASGFLTFQPGTNIDMTLGGGAHWTTEPQLNASFKKGLDEFVQAINDTRGGRKVCMCNGALGPNGTGNTSSSADLWMGRLFEGFSSNPLSAFSGSAGYGWTTFDEMMASPLLTRWTGPGIDGGGTAFIKGETDSGTQGYNATYNKQARYTLGLASLLGGYACVNWDGQTVPSTPPGDSARWADEYSVTNGVHDQTHAGCGWLGRPIGVATKHASTIWFREFQNGIVLVNGAAFGGATMTLPGTFKRIQGLRDTVANDGATVTSQAVPYFDARFLLRV